MNYWYLALKWILRIIFAAPLYIDYHRKGKVDKKPKIFVANHPSTFDPILLMTVLPEQVASLITGGVFHIPIIGWILTKVGHVPVHDNQGRKAYEAIKKQLMRGKSILIFPEGQLSHEDGSVKALFSGAVRLAAETNVPIVPIGISMSNKRWIKKKIFLGGKTEYARFFLLGTYAITVGLPMILTGPIHDHVQKTVNKAIVTKHLSALISESYFRIIKNK